VRLRLLTLTKANGVTYDLSKVKANDDEIVGAALGTIDGIEARREVVMWDGIFGRYVIFRAEDVAHLSDDELRRMVRVDSKLADDEKVYVQRDDEKVSCSYGIETDD